MGILYVVGTPIGNLQDITIRAIHTLFEVDVIACEDTRRTGVLLENLHHVYDALLMKEDHSQNTPKLLSYYEQNELRRIPEIVSLLINDQAVALVTDAGMPAISDPGFKLIRECIKQGIKVEVIPGASAPITALAASGLPTDKFMFVGYPPRKPGHRIKYFENIRESQKYIKYTVILFEAPHKLVKTLEEMQSVFGDIAVVLARELTKMHEEVKSRTITNALTHYKKQSPKGEFVVLFTL